LFEAGFKDAASFRSAFSGEGNEAVEENGGRTMSRRKRRCFAPVEGQLTLRQTTRQTKAAQQQLQAVISAQTENTQVSCFAFSSNIHF